MSNAFSDDSIQKKYEELLKKTNIGDEAGNISFARLNKAMIEYPGNYAWVLMQAEEAENLYNITKRSYDVWKSQMFVDCINSPEKIAGKYKSVKEVDALIIAKHAVEMGKQEEILHKLEYQKEVLKGFKSVWEQMGKLLQTLSANLRAELTRSEDLDSVAGHVAHVPKDKLSKVLRLKRKSQEGREDGYQEDASNES